MTYLLISLPFIIFSGLVFSLAGVRGALPPGLPIVITALVMFVLTLVFDNLIISSGIVAYDEELFLGIMLGVAPIEDFLYSLAAVLLIPTTWNLLEKRGLSR